VFGGVVIASVTSTGLQLYRENPAALRSTIAMLTQSYLLNAEDPIGFHAAGRLLEGLGLMAAAAEIGQGNVRYRVPLLVCLVASGVVASIASGLLAIGVAPAQTLARHAAVGLARYSAVTSDVNAAASSYLLLAGVSLGIAAYGRRTRPAWLAAAVIMLGALVLTGSGSAFIASAVVVCAAVTLWLTSVAPLRWKIAGALVVALLAAGAIAFTRTARSTSSLEMRGGFTTTSMRLIEARPVFGVGAGRYYPLSKLVFPPALSLVYPHENAHNYYLQIAAELGIVGAAALMWVLGAALVPAVKRVWMVQAEGLMAGCVGGASGYLVTALGGHPFLVPETAIPFWIVLGLIVTRPATPLARSGWRGAAAIAVACGLLLTAPLRGTAVGLPAGDYGVGPWQTDDSGRRFREAEGAASLFVGPTTTSVEIPMRVSRDRAGGLAIVAFGVAGSFISSKDVGGAWTTHLVQLPGSGVLEPRQRIDLSITLLENGARSQRTARLDVGEVRVVGVK
jgi:O-antigen ligase